MGHLTSKDAYKTLDQRLNLFPQDAPPSESLYKILQVLFTEKEARMVSQLPIRPFTAAKAAKIWQLSELATEKFLDSLCDKALLVDSFHKFVLQAMASKQFKSVYPDRILSMQYRKK